VVTLVSKDRSVIHDSQTHRIIDIVCLEAFYTAPGLRIRKFDRRGEHSNLKSATSKGSNETIYIQNNHLNFQPAAFYKALIREPHQELKDWFKFSR
jgi:hypothetical protein